MRPAITFLNIQLSNSRHLDNQILIKIDKALEISLELLT